MSTVSRITDYIRPKLKAIQRFEQRHPRAAALVTAGAICVAGQLAAQYVTPISINPPKDNAALQFQKFAAALLALGAIWPNVRTRVNSWLDRGSPSTFSNIGYGGFLGATASTLISRLYRGGVNDYWSLNISLFKDLSNFNLEDASLIFAALLFLIPTREAGSCSEAVASASAAVPAPAAPKVTVTSWRERISFLVEKLEAFKAKHPLLTVGYKLAGTAILSSLVLKTVPLATLDTYHIGSLGAIGLCALPFFGRFSGRVLLAVLLTSGGMPVHGKLTFFSLLDDWHQFTRGVNKTSQETAARIWRGLARISNVVVGAASLLLVRSVTNLNFDLSIPEALTLSLPFLFGKRNGILALIGAGLYSLVGILAFPITLLLWRYSNPKKSS